MSSENNESIDILIKKYRFTDLSEDSLTPIVIDFYKSHTDVTQWIKDNLDYFPIHITADYDPRTCLTTVRVSCRFKNKEHATQFLLTHNIEA